MRFPMPDGVGDRPRGELQRSGRVAFLIRALGRRLDLSAFGRPLMARLGKRWMSDSSRQRTAPHRPQLLERATDPRQLLHTLGIVVLGPEL